MELVRKSWTIEDYENLIDFVREHKDEEYKKFHSKLVPDLNNFIGVRVPVLKNIGKQIAKGNYQEFMIISKCNLYEEKMIKGAVICNIKDDLENILSYINDFLPYIDNWAVCDTFCSGLKIVKKYRNEFYEYIKKCLESERPFTIRFGLVLLLGYYIDDEYIDRIFEICDNIKSQEYYVKMANAWLLSMCYVKLPDKTKEYLKGCRLDDWTYNKAIQKAIESTRISDNERLLLKSMKRA